MKMGHVSPNAQVFVNSFTPLRYPANESPASPSAKIDFFIRQLYPTIFGEKRGFCRAVENGSPEGEPFRTC